VQLKIPISRRRRGPSTFQHGADGAQASRQDPRTRLIAPPIELAEFRYIQVWHPRMDSDPAHLWLRRMFTEAVVAN
jgi:hypothetical protein